MGGGRGRGIFIKKAEFCKPLGLPLPVTTGGGVVGVFDPRRRLAGRKGESKGLVVGVAEVTPVLPPFFFFTFPFPPFGAAAASAGTRMSVPSIIFAFGRNPEIRPRLRRITSADATWNLCAMSSTVSLSNAAIEVAGASILLIARHVKEAF